MVDQQVLKRRLRRLLKRPENIKCADCNRKAPRWASVNIGCIFCLECSGIHRSLGVQISYVRSIELDTWSEAQVEFMEQWGNARVNAYYEAKLPSEEVKPTDSDSVAALTKYIRDKYVKKAYIGDSPPPPPTVPKKKVTSLQQEKKACEAREHAGKQDTQSSDKQLQLHNPPHAIDVVVKKKRQLDLKGLNVAPSSISFNTCTFHSERFIAVRSLEEGRSSSDLIVVDSIENSKILHMQTSAESAIMHPFLQIAALRNGSKAQIYDLQNKSIIKSWKFREDILFWRWVSSSCIGIVCTSAVWHWFIGDEGQKNEPFKVFNRDSNITTQSSLSWRVINYLVSPSGKWCLLVTLVYMGSGDFGGEMQLFSLDKQLSQLLDGRNGVFVSLKLPDLRDPIEVLCFEHKEVNGSSKIRIMQVGFNESVTSLSGAPVTPFKTDPVVLDDMQHDDFPVGMSVCPKYDVLYIFTSKGRLFLIAIELGILLSSQRVEDGTVFSCCPSEMGGTLYLTRNDTTVVHISIDVEALQGLLSQKGLLKAMNGFGEKLKNVASLATKSDGASGSFTTQGNEGRKEDGDSEAMWRLDQLSGVFDDPPPPPPESGPSRKTEGHKADSSQRRKDKKHSNHSSFAGCKDDRNCPDCSKMLTQLSESNRQLKETQSENDALRIELSNMRGRADSLDSTLSQLSECSRQLKETRSENATLRNELSNIRGRVDSLNSIFDCESYEQELLQSIQRVKERKAHILRAKEKEESDQKYCVVCEERLRNVILLPCGHICLCLNCIQANNFQACPLDRKKIENYQIVYF